MRIRFTIFGFEVWALEFGQPGEEVEYEAVDDTGITGGSAHNFERDTTPIDPSGEEPWYEDRGFGFRK